MQQISTCRTQGRRLLINILVDVFESISVEIQGVDPAATLRITEQNLCGEFRHMKTPQRTPHVVVIQDVVKMT